MNQYNKIRHKLTHTHHLHNRLSEWAFLLVFLLLALSACRHPEVVEQEDLTFAHGLYVLNEGNMGSNKASIDFYDPISDTLYRNIYPTVNPTVMKELGDVGNDIAIYGGKLYAVINVSGKVEIMDLQARRISSVDIPNCRSICFADGYAYVSSYAGPVEINPNYQRGYVAKIDTVSLCIVDTCHVGYQPNGLVSDGSNLYVANSGGYMAPNYDSTLSVISLFDFCETKRIPIAVNLDQIVYDANRNTLYVRSQGDYYTQPEILYELNLLTEEVKPMPVAFKRMHLLGDKLYGYTGIGKNWQMGYLDLSNFSFTTIPLENQSELQTPYALFITDNDLYLTDARDYVTPGVLYRYNLSGQLLSKQRTGDIPAHFCMKE